MSHESRGQSPALRPGSNKERRGLLSGGVPPRPKGRGFPLLDEKGQAVIEYILMAVVALSLVSIITTSFRRSLIQIWGFYISEISAACPGCPPNPDYRFR